MLKATKTLCDVVFDKTKFVFPPSWWDLVAAHVGKIFQGSISPHRLVCRLDRVISPQSLPLLRMFVTISVLFVRQ